VGASYVLDDDDDNDDVYFKKITTRVSQNVILHKNADQPKAYVLTESMGRADLSQL
jgi:hypothetical protein